MQQVPCRNKLHKVLHMRHPRKRGQPSKAIALSNSEPSPDRMCSSGITQIDIEVTPVMDDKDSIEHASQAHI